MSSGQMMLGLTGIRTVWHVVWTDGIVDRWASGRDGMIIQTADKDSENFCLESGIPDKSIFTNK